MASLGVLFTCFDETTAVYHSIQQFISFYPDSPIFLVSESDEDFSFVHSSVKRAYIERGADTMFFYNEITDQNFRARRFQELVYTASVTFMNRVLDAIEFCQTDYLLLMDPDTLVRGKLNIPEGAVLLGSRINHGFPQQLKDVLASVPGAIVIDSWGATPAIIHCNTFKQAYQKLYDSQILKDFVKAFYAIFAHDVILPLLFALVGKEETFNPDIIECKRHPGWEQSRCPLVHQFKLYYPN